MINTNLVVLKDKSRYIIKKGNYLAMRDEIMYVSRHELMEGINYETMSVIRDETTVGISLCRE